MAADTCPTCPEKDDQIAALAKLLKEGLADRFLYKGHTTVFCPNLNEPKPQSDDPEPCWECRTKALLADLPAAARERAEERERLRKALEELMAGFSHGGAKVECPCVACKQGRAALAGEKAEWPVIGKSPIAQRTMTAEEEGKWQAEMVRLPPKPEGCGWCGHSVSVHVGFNRHREPGKNGGRYPCQVCPCPRYIAREA